MVPSGGVLQVDTIRPRAAHKPFPEYIPLALREDYQEAVAVRELSPKAAATLARRCIQGMIRDFCNIQCKTLYREIESLTKQVQDGTARREVAPDTVDQIDAVRRIGNIGAHMEHDVDKIIPIDPGEVEILIELIEILFRDWYIASHDRKAASDRLNALADQKDKLKKTST